MRGRVLFACTVLLCGAIRTLAADDLPALERSLATTSATERLALLGRLSEGYRFVDARKSFEYAEQALTLARSLGDRKAEAAALRNLGIASDITGDHRKAIAYATESIAIYQRLGDRKAEAALE